MPWVRGIWNAATIDDRDPLREPAKRLSAFDSRSSDLQALHRIDNDRVRLGVDEVQAPNRDALSGSVDIERDRAAIDRRHAAILSSRARDAHRFRDQYLCRRWLPATRGRELGGDGLRCRRIEGEMPFENDVAAVIHRRLYRRHVDNWIPRSNDDDSMLRCMFRQGTRRRDVRRARPERCRARIAAADEDETSGRESERNRLAR